MPRSSAVLEAAPPPFQVTAARVRQLVVLRDIDIAPENLRSGEPPDADIPLLADTLFAAGQLQPITVRPGRRKERGHMALDGRRRVLALRLLVEQGRIDDGFLVDVFVETDPARQAAAVVLTNTAVPVHVADVIAAIGRMLGSRLGLPVMARALGYAELEVKRLAALSALPQVALDALKAGRLTLKQARLLARLSDPDEQAELARLALDGHGFPDWRINERLDLSQVNASDPRCVLIGPDVYAAAGGRAESDLFGERPPILLDPSILTDLWMSRMRTIALPFEAEGLAVHVTAGSPPELDEDLETPGYVYGGMLPAAEMAAYRDACTRHQAAEEAAEALIVAGQNADEIDAALSEVIRARLTMDQIALGGRVVTTVVITPAQGAGIQVRSWTPMEPEIADPSPSSDAEDASQGADEEAFVAPVFEAPEPDVEGVNHALHAVRTEVATRGLIRALADDPRTAMTALIARLFSQVAIRRPRGSTESVLAITARVFNPTGGRVIEELDGVVRQRLDDRRADWEASGQTLIGWVHALDDQDRLALLGDLTALTLDLREARTGLIQRQARAEAAELATLCGAALTRYWTPDTEFLTAHSKTLLLGMLDALEDADAQAATLKKTDLVARVAERAADRRWAPPGLSWALPAGAEDADLEGSAEDEAAEDDDGTGAFEITACGLAALVHAAE